MKRHDFSVFTNKCFNDYLDKAIKNGLDELINLYKNGSIFFKEETNYNYHKIYEDIKKYYEIDKVE